MQRDLVERAMEGDHDAFAALVRVSAAGLLRVANLILRDTAAAEDATQEALVAAWRSIRGLRDPDRFQAWIHRLLVNECHREGRRVRRAVQPVRAVVQSTADPDASATIGDRDQLDRGFSRLPEDQRVVLVLHYYVGLTLDEVAGVLRLPTGTVRSRLHRGTRAMRAALEADARLISVGQGGPA